jgi:hypothetical protein
MKHQIAIFGFTFFSLFSCGEDRTDSEHQPASRAQEFDYKTKRPIREIETADSVFTVDYLDLLNDQSLKNEIDLFWLRDLEENSNIKVGFVSLSDLHFLSDHPDSLAIPERENADASGHEYFKLPPKYRKRFLTKTKISETDSVYVYDYSKDVLLSFPVKNLNVVAYLSLYENVKDCPCDQYDYMIGFELPKKNLKGLGANYYDVLVYVGNENPFARGHMKPMVFTKISSDDFPSDKVKRTYSFQNNKKGGAYSFVTGNFQFFIQDYFRGNEEYVDKRYLIVVDKRNGNVILERLFGESESTGLYQINLANSNSEVYSQDHWTGKLFKNKPEVVFGFEGVSFGCPNIIFLDAKKPDIYINCDNRH